MDKTLIERMCEYASPSILYDHSALIEEEPIYETPYGDEDDYGPIYSEPPNEMDKIYGTFETKIFFHENIR